MTYYSMAQKKITKEDPIDFSGVVQYLEGVWRDRMVALGDVPEKDREKVYDAVIAPYIAAVNILKAHGTGN